MTPTERPWSAYRKLQLIANGGAVALGVDWWRKAAKEGCDRIAELEAENEKLRGITKLDHPVLHQYDTEGG